MKILDLLEKQIETVVSPDGKYRGKFKNVSSPNDGSAGFFSRVKDDKTDPHMIVKNTIKPQYSDGYHTYIKELIERDLIDTNPHFPRVYNVKRIEDRHGYNVYKYTMEKLVRLVDLSPEMQKAVLVNNFKVNPEELEILENKYEERAIGFYIAEFLEAGAGGDVSRIKSSSLVDALKVLGVIKEENNMLSFDIHINNYMIRMTSHGPQIVLTDPFS